MAELTMQEDMARQSRFYSSVVWITLAGMVGFFIWAYFATLDEVTVGTGKVTTSIRAQLIESLDGGIVSALLVHEGDIVKKGQILRALIPSDFSLTTVKPRPELGRFVRLLSVCVLN